jgi:hypothetical protein
MFGVESSSSTRFFGHTDAARLSTLAMSEQLQSLTAGSLGDVPWGKKNMAIGNPVLWENQVQYL